VKTPLPPDELTNGLYTALESDGRLTFILARRKKPVGQVTLPASEAGQVAASALSGAYEAFDRVGTCPPESAGRPTPLFASAALASVPAPSRVTPAS
jgi:hypothetical protein